MALEENGGNDVVETSDLRSDAKTFKEFLESHPPGGSAKISDLWRTEISAYGPRHFLNSPDLFLHCTHQDCNGHRYFRCNSGEEIVGNGGNSFFVAYQCSNCKMTKKRYALFAVVDTEDKKQRGKGIVEKYGEVPAFGPPTPTRLLRLFGDEKDVFLRGRRCESQGLGIGAYAYYRRIVENHKDNIFNEIIKVCEKIGVSNEIVTMLTNAKKEKQFTSALEKAKDAMPAALLINGQNPLTLLHSALSEGIHAKNDAQCLESANDIRIVLSELANRLGQALNDEKELTDAVHRLISRKSQNKTPEV